MYSLCLTSIVPTKQATLARSLSDSLEAQAPIILQLSALPLLNYSELDGENNICS